MTYDAPPDWLDRELVLTFFWKFSVFECALKREGFLSVGSNDAAQPDWYAFGNAIRGRFPEVCAEGFQEAIRTLKTSPPCRQVVQDSQLDWKPITPNDGETEEAFVLRLVKTARNNLFHGGKYPDGPVDEVARDKTIMQAALRVLEGCYELHSGIAGWLKEAA